MSAAGKVVIDDRFRGPPESANGGYACGLLAGRFPAGRNLRITLRRPIPLERSLVVMRDGRGLALHDRQAGEDLVIAQPCEPEPLGDLPSVGVEDARAARPPAEMLERHPFPGCFGCGPQRDPAEAVALHVGQVGDAWATVWNPGPGLPHEPGGQLTSEVVWAALDCPSGFAAVPAGAPAHVLGRLEGRVDASPRVGDELVVTAWALGSEGRKRWGATAIHDAGGRLLAHARATWIALA